MSLILNKSQLEILKLLEKQTSEQDFNEIKSLITRYLSFKVTEEADMAFNEKYDTESIFEIWKDEHFRKSA
jgi:hypothetical protein